jgi:hypothetical protein
MILWVHSPAPLSGKAPTHTMARMAFTSRYPLRFPPEFEVMSGSVFRLAFGYFGRPTKQSKASGRKAQIDSVISAHIKTIRPYVSHKLHKFAEAEKDIKRIP